MFIVNTTIAVNWVLPSMVVPTPLEDLDVRLRAPDGTVTIIESAIAAEDYIPPTDTQPGGVTYQFTPDSKGVWLVVLVVVSETAPVYNEYFLEVWVNDTHIYQQVRM